MRSPHTIEIQFVFNNIKIAGPLISKMPEAYALAEKTSAAWAAFARTGDPNTPKLPKWPAYSAAARDTMLFNNECRVEPDPDRGPRLVDGASPEALIANHESDACADSAPAGASVWPRASATVDSPLPCTLSPDAPLRRCPGLSLDQAISTDYRVQYVGRHGTRAIVRPAPRGPLNSSEESALIVT